MLLAALAAVVPVGAGPTWVGIPTPTPETRVWPASPEAPSTRSQRLLLNACGGETDPVRYWSRMLRSEDAEVRTRAARALGESRREAAVPALMAALGDPDEAVRLAAVDALARMRGSAREAVPALERALADQAPAVRAAAGRALDQIRATR